MKWWPIVFSDTDKSVIGYAPAPDDAKDYLDKSLVFGNNRERLISESIRLVGLGKARPMSLQGVTREG